MIGLCRLGNAMGNANDIVLFVAKTRAINKKLEKRLT